MTNNLHLSLANILIIGQPNLWAVNCLLTIDNACGSEIKRGVLRDSV
jgi:hypothetical protein